MIKENELKIRIITGVIPRLVRIQAMKIIIFRKYAYRGSREKVLKFRVKE